MSHGLVPDRAARLTRGGLAPLGRRLAALGIGANAVTAVGVVLTIAGAALLATDRPLPALAVLIAGSLADTLDGVVARATGGGTRLGAFLDSTADRIADSALLSAAAYLGAARGDATLLVASLIAVSASSLVPYVRAKAESLGVPATVGPAPREARLVILLLGLAAWAVMGSPEAFTGAVALVAILATVTFLQRVTAVARALGTNS